jgi:protein-L-isoaspartate(D-aspartate) O-methyltransferase
VLLAATAAARGADADAARREMVDAQIRARGVRDGCVLEAMRFVPRHLFVPEAQREHAHADRPLHIGHGQTISQPYIVAYMTEALRLTGSERVLEIGTGSGYQAAVLARCARSVFTVEIRADLAHAARERLEALGFGQVRVRAGDGRQGWPEHAPYDAIMVTAAASEVPPALIEQLVEGGVLVMPKRVSTGRQILIRGIRAGDRLDETELLPVAFVPLIGGTPDQGRGEDGRPAGAGAGKR